jgi:type VI secretion system protein ImpA
VVKEVIRTVPLRDDLLNPIPGDNPSGESLRYAPVYDQIKEARREEDEIAQGDWKTERKKADWVLVTKLCGEALARKSKDLQLAAWLTEAQVHREGYAGLNSGLTLIHGLLENFWDTLYPELEDGDAELRATPLDWVGSRLDGPLRKVPITRGGLDWLKYKESRGVPSEEDASASEAKLEARNTAVSEGKLTPEEFDADFAATPKSAYEQWQADLDACLESIDALNGLCEEKFGDVAPNFSGLKKTVEELKQTVRILLVRKREAEPDGEAPAAEPAEETGGGYYEEQATESAPAAAAAPARAPIKVKKAPAGPEPVDREDAIARVESAARYLRQNDAYNPAGYLLLRGLRWGELRASGGDVDASLLEAPDTAVRQELKRLFNEGEYQQALDVAEAAMGQPCGRGWLDLQRYAVRCCDNLGYYQPAAAIRSELKALLADLPGLLELTLLDDTPVANAETRAWIEEEVSPPAAGRQADAWAPAPAEGPPAQEDGVERPPDVFEMALEACRSGRAEEGIEMLAREAAQEPSARARFQRKVQLAQICLGAGHDSVAYPILEGLAQEIEERRLEDWEAPEMIAHALALLFRSMRKVEVSPEQKQKVYNRICRLDPVQALAVSR